MNLRMIGDAAMVGVVYSYLKEKMYMFFVFPIQLLAVLSIVIFLAMFATMLPTVIIPIGLVVFALYVIYDNVQYRRKKKEDR